MSEFTWPVPAPAHIGYSTQADVEIKCGGFQSLVQLTTQAGDPPGVVNVTVLTSAIVAADGIIDAYINKQVMVPLAVVPPLIVHLSARMAAYELRVAKKMVDPETHGKAQEADLKMLDMIKSGEITLGMEPPPPKASARIDGQSERPTSKTVSRAKLRGFS